MSAYVESKNQTMQALQGTVDRLVSLRDAMVQRKLSEAATRLQMLHTQIEDPQWWIHSTPESRAPMLAAINEQHQTLGLPALPDLEQLNPVPAAIAQKTFDSFKLAQQGIPIEFLLDDFHRTFGEETLTKYNLEAQFQGMLGGLGGANPEATGPASPGSGGGGTVVAPVQGGMALPGAAAGAGETPALPGVTLPVQGGMALPGAAAGAGGTPAPSASLRAPLRSGSLPGGPAYPDWRTNLRRMLHTVAVPRLTPEQALTMFVKTKIPDWQQLVANPKATPQDIAAFKASLLADPVAQANGFTSEVIDAYGLAGKQTAARVIPKYILEAAKGASEEKLAALAAATPGVTVEELRPFAADTPLNDFYRFMGGVIKPQYSEEEFDFYRRETSAGVPLVKAQQEWRLRSNAANAQMNAEARLKMMGERLGIERQRLAESLKRGAAADAKRAGFARVLQFLNEGMTEGQAQAYADLVVGGGMHLLTLQLQKDKWLPAGAKETSIMESLALAQLKKLRPDSDTLNEDAASILQFAKDQDVAIARIKGELGGAAGGGRRRPAKAKKSLDEIWK